MCNAAPKNLRFFGDPLLIVFVFEVPRLPAGVSRWPVFGLCTFMAYPQLPTNMSILPTITHGKHFMFNNALFAAKLSTVCNEKSYPHNIWWITCTFKH